jgi:hypothetical protein
MPAKPLRTSNNDILSRDRDGLAEEEPELSDLTTGTAVGGENVDDAGNEEADVELSIARCIRPFAETKCVRNEATPDSDSLRRVRVSNASKRRAWNRR